MNLREVEKNNIDILKDSLKERRHYLTERNTYSNKIEFENNVIATSIKNIIQPISDKYKIRIDCRINDTGIESFLPVKIDEDYFFIFCFHPFNKKDGEIIDIENYLLNMTTYLTKTIENIENKKSIAKSDISGNNIVKLELKTKYVEL